MLVMWLDVQSSRCVFEGCTLFGHSWLSSLSCDLAPICLALHILHVLYWNGLCGKTNHTHQCYFAPICKSVSSVAITRWCCNVLSGMWQCRYWVVNYMCLLAHPLNMTTTHHSLQGNILCHSKLQFFNLPLQRRLQVTFIHRVLHKERLKDKRHEDTERQEQSHATFSSSYPNCITACTQNNHFISLILKTFFWGRTGTIYISMISKNILGF